MSLQAINTAFYTFITRLKDAHHSPWKPNNMKTKSILVFTILFGMIHFLALGQEKVYFFGKLETNKPIVKIPEVARISIPSSNVLIKSSKRHCSFSAKSLLYNNETRLQISSVVDEQSSRVVTAHIASGSVPKGTTLRLSVIPPNDSFKGDPGESKNSIVLGQINKPVLSEIGTCYSGRKNDDGYGLEYTYEIPEGYHAENLSCDPIIITMTLAANY